MQVRQRQKRQKRQRQKDRGEDKDKNSSHLKDIPAHSKPEVYGIKRQAGAPCSWSSSPSYFEKNRPNHIYLSNIGRLRLWPTIQFNSQIYCFFPGMKTLPGMKVCQACKTAWQGCMVFENLVWKRELATWNENEQPVRVLCKNSLLLSLPGANEDFDTVELIWWLIWWFSW